MNKKQGTFILATNNAHKAQELEQMLGGSISLKTLKSVGFTDEIVEDAETFAGNALIKCNTVHKAFSVDVIADDSGLVVEALDGAPGIYSARYAGVGAKDGENVQKLLREMEGKSNRKAYFICVIALVLHGLEYVFEGRVHGEIADSIKGEGGFGYDPIFIPEGHTRSFAEFTADEKNAISHRANAVEKLKEFLDAQ